METTPGRLNYYFHRVPTKGAKISIAYHCAYKYKNLQLDPGLKCKELGGTISDLRHYRKQMALKINSN